MMLEGSRETMDPEIYDQMYNDMRKQLGLIGLSPTSIYPGWGTYYRVTSVFQVSISNL